MYWNISEGSKQKIKVNGKQYRKNMSKEDKKKKKTKKKKECIK